MNDVSKLVDRLNALQRIHLANFGLSVLERREWKSIVEQIKQEGYVLKHRRMVWKAVLPDEARNAECPFIYTNVRPTDGGRVLNGDCTTRALKFCLPEMTYREIEREQYALAAEENLYRAIRVRRNSNTIWEKVILNRGYMKINLIRAVKRSVLAIMLRGHLTAPVISKSSGHVAVIDIEGAVRDIWDSRGGKVTTVYVKTEDVSGILSVLGTNYRHDIVLPIKENYRTAAQ